jgi:hypothetical protein
MIRTSSRVVILRYFYYYYNMGSAAINIVRGGYYPSYPRVKGSWRERNVEGIMTAFFPRSLYLRPKTRGRR